MPLNKLEGGEQIQSQYCRQGNIQTSDIGVWSIELQPETNASLQVMLQNSPLHLEV